MSTFVGITCYGPGGREAANLRRLRREDLEAAVASLPRFKLVDEDGALGVKLPGSHQLAVLEGSGVLSCQLDGQTDTELLIDDLRELASTIPGAVVEDEDGNEC